MGKHVFTLNLKLEIEATQIEDGETGTVLNVNPETLYHLVTSLRSEALSEIDELTAGEFEEAVERANEINGILEKIEDLDDLVEANNEGEIQA